MMKKLLTMLLVLACLLGATVTAIADTLGVGNTMPDFTVETASGEQYTLSKILEEKDLVVINIWASWCGYCIKEFPYLQQVYEQYQDRMEILALDCEPTDTDEQIRDIASEYGLTFPMGQDSLNIAGAFGISGIPCSILVDRFGSVSLMMSGAMPSAQHFMDVCDYFLSERYTESRYLGSAPSKRPSSVVMPDEADLAAALNVEGGNLTFANPAGDFAWPMAITEKDGRACVVSTNAGMPQTDAEVRVKLTAQESDVLAFDFRLSSEVYYDTFKLVVDGVTVKAFSGERDWSSYAYAFTSAGEHEVRLVYQKDHLEDAGEDALWLSQVRLLSGEAAAIALSNNPAYPVATATSLTLEGEDVREILMSQPLKGIDNVYDEVHYYIVSGTQAMLKATLAADIDPERAVLLDSTNELFTVLSVMTSEDGYSCPATVEEDDDAQINIIYAQLRPEKTQQIYTIVYFSSEADVDQWLDAMFTDEITWTYAEAIDPVYEVNVVDETGAPVSGVMLQACTDKLCSVYFTDESGHASFTAETPYAYEIHVLRATEGYQVDSQATFVLPVNGGSVTITLKKK